MTIISKSTLSRRALIAGTAAIPAAVALALPAGAAAAPADALDRSDAANALANSDPIFAAIEAHRKADAEFGDCVERKCALENALPRDRRKSNNWSGEQTIVETDDPRWIAAVREEVEGSDLRQEAALTFMSTEPTTIAGVYAMLAYFADVEVIDCGMAWPDSLHDDDDPAVTRHGASTGYFVARAACRTLARIAQTT